MKTCTKCKIEKPIDEFLKHRNECKCCARQYKKEYRSRPENSQKDKEYRSRPEVKLRSKEYQKEYKIEYQKTPKRIEYIKEYNSRPEVKKKRNQNQKKRSKSLHYRTVRNNRARERYNTDTDYYFSVIVAKHIRTVEKRDDFKREWDDVKDVYEMYGIEYHIDHKVPRNWFKSNAPKTMINDLRNLQVIDAKYNLTKKDKWCDPVCSDYLEIIKPYIKKEFVNRLVD